MNRASSTALSMMRLPERLTDEHDLIGQQKHYQYDVMGNVTQIKPLRGLCVDTPIPFYPRR